MQSLVNQMQHHLAASSVALQVELPNGQTIRAGSAQVALKMKHWASVARLASGQIGSLAQDYVEGNVELDGSLRELIRVAASLLPSNPTQTNKARRIMAWWDTMARRANSLAHHSLGKDAEQIQFHYDVGDDFYALWLCPRRVYSCAYYRNPSMNLAQAQEAKLDHICRKLMLKFGDRFLDVGAGWGGLLLWAVEHYGVRGKGITLSKNQHAYVSQLIASKGLQGRAQVQLQDYRHLDAKKERFDKIASVGMFEHVGDANMTAYCAQLAALLVPGGLILNHGITAGGVDNAQLGAGMGDFIEKYIFPGGELLHISAIQQHLARGGLETLDTENLRPHYARTLWAWSDALEAQRDAALDVLTQRCGSERAEKILRAYRLYLAGSAMSFEQGWISLHQLLSTCPSGQLGGTAMAGAQTLYPFEREYMYH
jgi:cyclopropane-fatty-acyl-phospholipid synthase